MTPIQVRGAFVAWIVAVGAGVFETVLVVVSGRAGEGAVPGVLLRVAVFAAATFVAFRMRAGRNWARLALTAGLGVVGLLSLLVGPIQWLANGNSLPRPIGGFDAVDLAFGASRTLHVLAVLTACALMFGPAANDYFRRRVVSVRSAS